MKRLILGTALLAMVGIVGCSTTTERPKLSLREAATTTATATVTAIDYTTRKVSLQRSDKSVVSFVAGPEVRNFAQVKVGDTVTVELRQEIEADVLKGDGTLPSKSGAIAVGRAKLGEKPAAAAVGSVTVTAVIESIDTNTNVVKLRGPEGRLVDYTAKNPENLKKVKVGDIAEITYTETLAIEVTGK